MVFDFKRMLYAMFVIVIFLKPSMTIAMNMVDKIKNNLYYTRDDYEQYLLLTLLVLCAINLFVVLVSCLCSIVLT